MYDNIKEHSQISCIYCCIFCFGNVHQNLNGSYQEHSMNYSAQTLFCMTFRLAGKLCFQDIVFFYFIF